MTGTGAPGDPFDDRPPSAPGGLFPKSLLPGVWPAADAKPRPADVIDYLGVEDRTHNLGYCYDIVPFGAAAPGPVAVATPNASLDAAAPWTARRAAVQTLNARRPDSKAKLLEVLILAGSCYDRSSKLCVNLFFGRELAEILTDIGHVHGTPRG